MLNEFSRLRLYRTFIATVTIVDSEARQFNGFPQSIPRYMGYATIIIAAVIFAAAVSSIDFNLGVDFSPSQIFLNESREDPYFPGEN